MAIDKATQPAPSPRVIGLVVSTGDGEGTLLYGRKVVGEDDKVTTVPATCTVSLPLASMDGIPSTARKSLASGHLSAATIPAGAQGLRVTHTITLP